ncbi:hypothetical protein [Natronosalvus vescus]|uniref:hypothetical protein n=1 Tax=Natronosalvus vescus TaxID=2953881 RepID=UPI0020909D57|nr:hypothetical protein [Natronosalvus vescus]
MQDPQPECCTTVRLICDGGERSVQVRNTIFECLSVERTINALSTKNTNCQYAVISSTLAGCLDILETDGSVQEVIVDLRNAESDESHTFHLALELENEIMDWESHTVASGTDELVTIDPSGDTSPVGLHGVVDDFADDIRFFGIDDVEEDFCLRLNFWSSHPIRERPLIDQLADIEC